MTQPEDTEEKQFEDDKVIVTYATPNPDRLRGATSDMVCFDDMQDFEK